MTAGAWQRIVTAALAVTVLLVAAGCSLSSQTDTAPVFEGPPTVNIASPQPNATYLEGTSVNILARVENAGPDMARVEVSMNGVIIGDQDVSGQTAPAFSISQSWPATQPGTYTVDIVAYRMDGTASQPASRTLTVRAAEDIGAQDVPAADGSDASDTTDDTGTDNPPAPPPPAPPASDDTDASGGETDTDANVAPPAQPTATPEPPTEEPTDTPEPPSPTPDIPRVVVQTGANVRSGPGTVFPVIGSLAANNETELLAQNPAGNWYKIRYYNGEGWIFANLVDTRGNTSNIATDIGPPTPAPTATPVPPTPTPIPAQVDLSIVDWSTNPAPLVCAESSATRIVVANTGSSTSEATTVVLEDLYNGSVQASESAQIQPLAPNTSQEVTINLTVATFFAEGHTLRARVDPDNTVNETDEGNNSRTFDYVLAPGPCG